MKWRALEINDRNSAARGLRPERLHPRRCRLGNPPSANRTSEAKRPAVAMWQVKKGKKKARQKPAIAYIWIPSKRDCRESLGTCPVLRLFSVPTCPNQSVVLPWVTDQDVPQAEELTGRYFRPVPDTPWPYHYHDQTFQANSYPDPDQRPSEHRRIN